MQLKYVKSGDINLTPADIGAKAMYVQAVDLSDTSILMLIQGIQ